MAASAFEIMLICKEDCGIKKRNTNAMIKIDFFDLRSTAILHCDKKNAYDLTGK